MMRALAIAALAAGFGILLAGVLYLTSPCDPASTPGPRLAHSFRVGGCQ